MSRRGRERRDKIPPAITFAQPYVTTGQLYGRPITAAEFIDRVRGYWWQEALYAIAELAALVAVHGPQSEEVRRKAVDPLLNIDGSSSGVARMKQIVTAERDRIVTAHEQVLSFLAHTAILYGADSGEGGLGDGELALWLLAGNEFLDEWAEPDSRPLTTKEELLATQVNLLRFNTGEDVASVAVRIREMLANPPQRGGLQGEAWRAVQEKAFGCPVEDYIENFLLPLATLAQGWGNEKASDGWERPIVSMNRIFGETPISSSVTDRWAKDLTATRDELKSIISQRLRSDGLPHSPTALRHRPLAQVDDDFYIAPLPRAFRAQLHNGVWARLFAATKAIHGDSSGAQIWTSTFGDALELWCRRISEHARDGGRLRGRLILPSQPGAADEIEDVVVVEHRDVVLFSVKSRFVREPIARHMRSRTEVIDWYDDFFFGDKRGKHREGVIRLLSGAIDRIRRGDFDDVLPARCRVYPVLVTYDSLCEEVFLYRRIEQLCEEKNLLQQDKVSSLTIAEIDEFEQLMAYAANGGRLVPLLRQRDNEWKHRRLDQMLSHCAPGLARHPLIEESFRAGQQRMFRRLFGQPLPD